MKDTLIKDKNNYTFSMSRWFSLAILLIGVLQFIFNIKLDIRIIQLISITSFAIIIRSIGSKEIE